MQMQDLTIPHTSQHLPKQMSSHGTGLGNWNYTYSVLYPKVPYLAAYSLGTVGTVGTEACT